MHLLSGLTRDPFAPTTDADLYWESTARAEVRERVEARLRTGGGIWLRGEAGSGRRTLLARAAAAVAGGHRSVAWCAAFCHAERPDVLSCLARLAGVEGPTVTGAIYGELVEGFCRGGPVILAVDGATVDDADREELGILGNLRLAGRPLVTLALWGTGESPVAGLEALDLPAPSAEDVRRFLRHRLAASGRPDLFSAAYLDRLAAEADGLAHALELGRQELLRLAFLGVPEERKEGELQDVDPSTERVLDPSDLAEVDRLLDALGDENASP